MVKHKASLQSNFLSGNVALLSGYTSRSEAFARTSWLKPVETELPLRNEILEISSIFKLATGLWFVYWLSSYAPV